MGRRRVTGAVDETEESLLGELVAFVRPMSAAARATAERFPPGCTVRAPGYGIPSVFVDSVGVVVSHFDNGDMTVMDDWPLNAGIRGSIDPAKATLVALGPITPEMIREACRRAGPPPGDN